MSGKLIVAVGAEGITEIEGQNWWRYTNKEENHQWMIDHPHTDKLFVDKVGRPYWLVVVLDHAPEEAKEKAQTYLRVKRLID